MYYISCVDGERRGGNSCTAYLRINIFAEELVSISGLPERATCLVMGTWLSGSRRMCM